MIIEKKLRYCLITIMLNLLLIVSSHASNTAFNNRKTYEEPKSSVTNHFSDVVLKGAIHIEMLEHTNKGSSYALLKGDIANARMLNAQGTRLKFGATKYLSDKTQISFTLKESGEKGLTFEDVFFSFAIIDNTIVYVGQKYAQTSLFIETDADKMLTMGFSRFYKIGHLFENLGLGLSIQHSFENFGIYYALYGNSIEEKTSETNRVAFNARTYYTPFNVAGNFMHFGVNYYIRNETYPTGHTPTAFSFTNPTNYTLFEAKNFQKIGAELMLNFGNFNIAGEYNLALLDPAEKAHKDLEVRFNIKNYFAQTSIILTGEEYQYKDGKFAGFNVANPVHAGGLGAIEVGFRYDYTDANDLNKGKAFDYGVHKDMNTVLNWYGSDNFKLIFSYSRIEEEFSNLALIAVNKGKKINKYNVFAAGTKIYF